MAKKKKTPQSAGFYTGTQPQSLAPAAQKPKAPSAKNPTPPRADVVVNKDRYGNVTSYETKTQGGTAYLNPKQQAQLIQSKKTGIAPKDATLLKLYQESVLKNKERNLQSPEFALNELQKGMEAQRVAELQGQFSQAQGQEQKQPLGLSNQLTANGLPTYPEEMGYEGAVPTKRGTISNTLGALKSVGGRAITKLASGNVMGAVGTAVGGLTYLTNTYNAGLLEDQTLAYSQAKQQMDNVISMAKQGLPREKVMQEWNNAVSDFIMVKSNLKRMNSQDPNYFKKEGADLSTKMNIIETNLNIYAQEIEKSVMQKEMMGI